MKIRRILWYLALLCWYPSFSQLDGLVKGSILDSIPVSVNSPESFALYLPERFDPGALSTILFIFDPGGRGSSGVRHFIPVAEKYNYILVCSNQVKNGPYETNLAITERLFDHIFSRFSIDEKGIYTTGFSGGSRMAVTIAVLSGAIQGVIACGAGFSGTTMYLPNNNSKFDYAGLVGDRDMNYQEMHKAHRWLTSIGVANELFTYSDDHNWPPTAQLIRAFDWMELQAVKKNIKNRGEEFVRSVFEENVRLAAQFEEQHKLLNAVTEYERVIRNYSDFYDLDTLLAKTRSLKKTKAFRAETRDQQRVASLEDTISSRFLKRFHQEVDAGQSRDDFAWWLKEIGKLDMDYAKSDREQLQLMSHRLRYQIYALALESFYSHVRNKDVPKSIYCSGLLLVQGPKDPYFHFIVARGFAQLNLIDQALNHLEQAIDNGWKNRDAIRDEACFRRIQNNARYRKLMQGI